MSDSLSKATTTAYAAALEVIAAVEPRIAEATRQELTDQRESLKLIASENYASPAVLLTMGTWLSDKYAEGTVGHRFYAGCQNVDTVESLAAEHARERLGERRVPDADDLARGAGGVGEGAEQVEGGVDAELAADVGHAGRGGVVDGGEQEAEAQVVQRALGDLVRGGHVDAQRGEHVGAARAGRGGA